eukprot:TRINITY_DN11824_c0_g3_i1.p1 TRINITY_DN11824_c0_g3~~TRINITY_DN11824_c0_g3_i1.p1  ORF type:complete len:650 (-),score=113.55 TRINITY_DN11824_c0_g3_i1:279-2228(-)
MKASDQVIDPPSGCSEATTAPLATCDVWADYVRDCRLSMEFFLEAHMQRTEWLLRRLGADQSSTSAGACYNNGALPCISEEQVRVGTGGNHFHTQSSAELEAADLAAASRLTKSTTSECWATDFVTKSTTEPEKDQSMSEKVYGSLEGILGSSSSAMKHLQHAIEDEEPKPENPSRMHALVRSQAFEFICGGVIALNTVFIVLGTNASIELASVANAAEKSHLKVYLEWAENIEYTFLGFYTIELILRLYVHRLFFFFHDDAGWNILDFVLVLASVGGFVISAFQSGGGKSSAGVMAMRATRLIKLAKLLRVVRAVRFFKQLHLFVDCVLGCLENLFWALIMIILVLLLFAIYFVQAFESWISDNLDTDSPSEDVQEAVAGIKQQFGSVQLGMLTLSKAISGGADWAETFEIVSQTGLLNSFVFLIMIIFFAVAVWNIIASIFFENTIKSATVDRDEEVLNRRRGDLEDAKELMHLCASADIDKSGSISHVEFDKFMQCPMIREFFLIRGLDIKNAAHFFSVINQASDGEEVGLEDFVGSCLRVKGPATSIDLHMLAFDAKTMHSKTKKFMTSASASLAHLTEKTDQALARLSENAFQVAALGAGLQGLPPQQVIARRESRPFEPPEQPMPLGSSEDEPVETTQSPLQL